MIPSSTQHIDERDIADVAEVLHNFPSRRVIKIAIIGSTGLLGSNLIHQYQRNGYELRTYSRNKTGFSFNKILPFQNIETELLNIFLEWKPDIVINAIAIVDLQKCEENPALCDAINKKIPAQLASIAKLCDSYFIHISSDHFFNDTNKKHTENSTVSLVNQYASSKYLAENAVIQQNSNALVVRTNIIGFRPSTKETFFEWLLGSLQKKEPIALFDDYWTSPISVGLLGPILIKCYEKRLKGIYNIASSETIDKYSFGLKTAELFKLAPDNITKGSIKEKPLQPHRATTLGLDVSKIEKKLDQTMPTINDSLDDLLKHHIGLKEIR